MPLGQEKNQERKVVLPSSERRLPFLSFRNYSLPTAEDCANFWVCSPLSFQGEWTGLSWRGQADRSWLWRCRTIPSVSRECQGKPEYWSMTSVGCGTGWEAEDRNCSATDSKRLHWDTVVSQLLPFKAHGDHCLGVWLWVIFGWKCKTRGFIPKSCRWASGEQEYVNVCFPGRLLGVKFQYETSHWFHLRGRLCF